MFLLWGALGSRPFDELCNFFCERLLPRRRSSHQTDAIVTTSGSSACPARGEPLKNIVKITVQSMKIKKKREMTRSTVQKFIVTHHGKTALS